MDYRRFEDLRVWQEARSLVGTAYQATDTCRDWDYRSQIRRAALSVMSNIAEGFERYGNKEYAYFLYIAKGSCGEVRSLLYAGKDRQLLGEQAVVALMSQTLAVSRMLAALISKVKRG